MSTVKKAASPGKEKARRNGIKTARKNGHARTKPVSQEGVYMLRPRRTPAALRRAKRLAATVRQELAAVEQGTLEETMSRLRGRPWL